MEYVIIQNKKDFKPLMKKYNSKWETQPFLWDTFKEETCYIPSEDCFISLKRAKELNYKLNT